jgi:plastocyanin
MKLNHAIITTLTLAVATQFATGGDITGKISLKGTPPEEKELPLDPNCGKLHGGAKATTHHYVTQGGGLGNVFVTLKGVSGKSTGASAAPIVIDQKGCEYVPHISACQTGQKINVKNSDPLLHNVHPTPVVDGNKEANKAHIPGPMILTFQFDKAEEFLRFKCDVHPWMFAYVSAFDHPWFAITGTNGSFRLPRGLPAGRYTLTAAHLKTGSLSQQIDFRPGEPKPVEFQFTVPDATQAQSTGITPVR